MKGYQMSEELLNRRVAHFQNAAGSKALGGVSMHGTTQIQKPSDG